MYFNVFQCISMYFNVFQNKQDVMYLRSTSRVLKEWPLFLLQNRIEYLHANSA
jgi:hypothetical protein